MSSDYMYVCHIFLISILFLILQIIQKKTHKKIIVLFTMFLLYFIFIFKDNFLDIATTLNSVTYLYDNK